jgi:hypothetical protein
MGHMYQHQVCKRVLRISITTYSSAFVISSIPVELKHRSRMHQAGPEGELQGSLFPSLT